MSESGNLSKTERVLNVSESVPCFNPSFKLNPIINADRGLPQVSIYQRDFKTKPLDLLNIAKDEKKLNAKKMHKEFYKAASIVKTSTYQDYYPEHSVETVNTKKAENEFKVHPNNPKRLSPTTGLPFCGYSTYEKSYKELGSDNLPPISQNARVIYSMPFMGRSLYRDSYKVNPLTSKAVQVKPKSHFALSYPFVGQSQSKLSYRPMQPEENMVVQAKKEVSMLSKSFVYPGFYQTIAKKDYIPKLIKIAKKQPEV